MLTPDKFLAPLTRSFVNVVLANGNPTKLNARNSMENSRKGIYFHVSVLSPSTLIWLAQFKFSSSKATTLDITDSFLPVKFFKITIDSVNNEMELKKI